MVGKPCPIVRKAFPLAAEAFPIVRKAFPLTGEATCIRQVNQSLRGWIEFFQIVTEAEEWELHKLDAHVRRRLRAIKLKHWKRRRTIVRRLIGLGVKAPTAWSVVYHRSKSWWALSGALPVNKALSNAWFRSIRLRRPEAR